MSAKSPASESIFPNRGSNLDSILEERLTPASLSAAKAAARCSNRLAVPAYIVGGPVRDMLLGWPVTDIDVVVEGDGIRFAGELAAVEGGKMVEYSRFGTALVIFADGTKVDVATAREERYVKPGALPTVKPGSLDGDLRRRDFTINAMAIRLGPDDYGLFIDTYGGTGDLKSGRIRVMHPGSFRDDPTRILRAVRFESRYRFSIDEETISLLAEAVGDRMLDEVSRQRLREEIAAVLKEDYASEAVNRLHATGVWQALFGEEFILPGQAEVLFKRADEATGWYSRLAAEHRLHDAVPWIVRWLSLMSEAPPGMAENITAEFHVGKAAQKCVSELNERRSKLVRFAEIGTEGTRSALYRLMEGLAPETLIYMIAASTREDITREVEQFLVDLRSIEALVNGNDMKELGIPESPLMGNLLERVFDMQLDGTVKNREEALKAARKLISSANDVS